MGVIQDLFGGSTSSTTNTPIVGGGTQNQFFQGLYGTGLGQNAQGYGFLQGMNPYGGQLTPDQNQNLTNAFGGWSPTTQGSDYLSQMLGGGAFNPNTGPFAQSQSNMQQYGGIGGYPTQLMHNMAQFGGTGGAGNVGMGNLMMYGAAGPAGQPLNNIAQSGTSGTWGNPLLQATQGQGAGASPLNTLMQGGGGMGAFNSLNQLASGQGTGATAGLQQMIQGGGNPINQLPAWQGMVGAQQRNIAEGQARLGEEFNASDNRFSSAYGTATADYQNQAVANQNAMLGQMVAGANENAQNRLLGASSTFGGMGAQAAGQLGGFGAAGAQQLGSQGYGAGNMLAQLGYGGSQGLSQASMYGAGQLFGGENQGAMGMYQGQNQTLPAFMQNNQAMTGLGMQGAQGMNSMLMGNLQTGAGLGQQQYNNAQAGINNQYQNWWQSQPQNNPLLPYMFGGATGYVGNTQSSSSGGILPGIGALAGGLISPIKLSDLRLKEDLTKVGKAGPLDLYTYRFKGLPSRQLGFIAQEVNEVYPEAVIPGSDSEPWMIKPGVLLEALARSAT